MPRPDSSAGRPDRPAELKDKDGPSRTPGPRRDERATATPEGEKRG